MKKFAKHCKFEQFRKSIGKGSSGFQNSFVTALAASNSFLPAGIKLDTASGF
jgi:hypothetical protein